MEKMDLRIEVIRLQFILIKNIFLRNIMTTCNDNAYQVISKNKDLSGIKALIDLAGLQTAVANLQNATFFVPSNQGLANSAALVEYLSDPLNKDLLRQVLLYHIYNKGALTTTDIVLKQNLRMSDDILLEVYPTLYYQYLPTLVDRVQENYNVTVGNISAKTNVYLQIINGLLQPFVIYYPKCLQYPWSGYNGPCKLYIDT